MWYLKSERDGSLIYLLAGKTYTVSRKEGDLVLADDQSISRTHAAILISNEGEVFLWDEGSKYGTFVYEGKSECKLEPNTRRELKIGDKLRFGLQWNVYVLGKMYFVVCTSSITLEEKRLLKLLLPKIGGSLSNDWNNHCTHLAMNQVSLTHKVVLTLAAGKPITTVPFWTKMVEAISDQLALPKIEDYLPPVGEEELQRQTTPDTLLPNQSRKLLFQGKVFVFSSEDTKNKIQPLVECGGGVCRSFQTLRSPTKVCCEPNYIVVRESDACKQAMPDIFAALKGRGLRAIPISEIGLAIYNNSLLRYCNPSWRKPVILGAPPSQSQGVCLVENTEDIRLNTQDIKTEPRENIVIPPSLGSVVSDTSIDTSRSVKRPLSTTPADNPPPKRQLQQKDTAKTSGNLQQLPQRSFSSSSKESEATCSFDISRGDLFDTTSQNTRSDEPATSSKNDSGLFKKPSPKKSSGIKRGRTDDDDIFQLPSPKKATTPGKAKKSLKLPSPIRSEDDKLDVTIEDDSDEEFQLPSRRKSHQLRIEDDNDDVFELPSSSSTKSKRIPGTTIGTTKKTNEPQEDEATCRNLEETRETAAPRKSASRTESRANGSRVETRIADPRAVTRMETSTTSTTVSAWSNGRGNASHVPSISEFQDKSVGVPIKKEEGDNDDEFDEEVLKINYQVGEMSLRRRPPLRDVSTNSIIDGKPNFKKFRKTRARIERTRIDLVVDANVSMFEGVPNPDDPIPNGDAPSPGDQVPASQDVLSVFPFTDDRSGSGPSRPGPSRPNRQRRVPDNDIVDDWTVP